jgi:quercetin dioxygenase-like cupin family protein
LDLAATGGKNETDNQVCSYNLYRATGFADGGVSSTEHQIDFPPGYQTVMGFAEIAPGTCAGRHTHPGIETSYILEGEEVLKVDGKPDQHLKAGDPIQIPAGVPHDGCTTTTGVKVLTVHVIEKGKPLGSPAP